LTDRFSIGGSFKLINQRIWNESASAIALDLGLIYTTAFHGLRLGMSIANYGTDMRMDGKDLLKQIDIDPFNKGNNETLVARMKTDDWPLPIFFRIGLAHDIITSRQNRLTLALDAINPTDNVESVNAGAEYCFRDRVYLRGGYKSLFKSDSEEGLTMGGGLSLPVSGMGSFRLDYAYVTFGVLDNVQTFAFTYSF
jgi:hypothetical protein